MNELTNRQFTHLKIHTQYSICEGALRTLDLAKYCKTNQIKAVGLCDSNNLCGALEFSETIAKSKTQPIIGTQTVIVVPALGTCIRNIIQLQSEIIPRV